MGGDGGGGGVAMSCGSMDAKLIQQSALSDVDCAVMTALCSRSGRNPVNNIPVLGINWTCRGLMPRDRSDSCTRYHTKGALRCARPNT